MSATYEITIEALEERTVRARVHLLNFQYPEVPANKCLGLQLLADAHHVLRDSYKDTNQTKKSATKLAARARAPRRVLRRAPGEPRRGVQRAVHRERRGGDRPDHRAQQRELREGRGVARTEQQRQPRAPAFRDLQMVQILEFEVAEARLLDHLVVGLTWETWMSARDEAY
ncbi:hypothetical protein [Nannocystis pusilla]|uniref:hypothetical protein n=1 Tax=Nannocystis pusilla TaxID=889268 RepID=UPI003B7D9C8E